MMTTPPSSAIAAPIPSPRIGCVPVRCANCGDVLNMEVDEVLELSRQSAAWLSDGAWEIECCLLGRFM